MAKTGPRARPTAATLQPFMDRLVRNRCRLTYAQQRIRELEALLAEHGVEIPASVTQVPPPDHQC